MDGCDHDALTCEVCRAPYHLRIHERLDLTWERLCSYASISFYAEFCTICATLASMVFLFFLIVWATLTVSSGTVRYGLCVTCAPSSPCASMVFLFFLIVVGNTDMVSVGCCLSV
ncbi:hypothetical protein CLOM_g10186 [Closterium sp. NIES-68]|nr:hypothetical protein CLOM_g10186 [Closterium sp. NIES-68]